jgi:hypothetical protein
MSMFDEDLFPHVAIKELVDSLALMRKEMEHGVQHEKDETLLQGLKFILAVMDNLQQELVGVTNLNSLELNKKVRVLAFMNLFHEAMEAQLGDDDEDFDDDDGDDDDFDDDDFDDDDDGDDDDSTENKQRSPKVENLLPKHDSCCGGKPPHNK